MSQNSHEHEHEHIVQPISTFIKVFLALIVLTGLTVLTSMYDFGMMNMVIAMGIAIAKSLLVILFFMQLKFDDLGNKVTFFAAFLFLAIFIGITSSDFLTRRPLQPVKVLAVAPAGETDQNKLRIQTPELIAKGKAIFEVQCVSCHGAEGLGNGAAAAALNPQPRNFHSGYWKYGGSPTRIFHTITNGSPGTAMAAFTNLSIEQRYALAHYVRQWAPNPPSDTPEDLKAAGLGGGATPPPKEVPPIPIEMAMAKIEEPDVVAMPMGKAPMHPESVGGKIYIQKCMACHGMNGSGGQVQMNQGQNPAVSPMTRPWVGLHADWVENSGTFIDVVSKHSPGTSGVGVGNLSHEEWNQLHSYSRGLVHQ